MDCIAHQAPLSMGILQARRLEWVAMPSTRGSSQPRDWTQVSRIAALQMNSFTPWATVNGKEVQKRGDICVCVWLIHFSIQWKLTQHCNMIIANRINLRKRKKKWPSPMASTFLRARCALSRGKKGDTYMWRPSECRGEESRRQVSGWCKVSLFCQLGYRTPRSPKILNWHLYFLVFITVY